MDRLRLPILSVAAIFVTVVALPAHARCHVGNVAAIPVAIDNNQLLARGAIDGHPVSVLIDTGSYMSLIWRSAAERLGLRLIGAPRMRLFFLRPHRILVDNATRKMVFTYEGGPVFQISN